MGSRRTFLKSASVGVGISSGAALGFWPNASNADSTQANERPGIGAIGLRYQGSVIAHKAAMFGNIVAVCDVDRN
ncbi:twin-arginine translocation signal domain-containing protein, partial [Planctomycetota bacterium]